MKGTVKKLLRYMGRYKGALVLVALCLVVSSGGSILSSYLLKPIINDYILPGDFPGLIKMLCLLGGAVFAVTAMLYTSMADRLSSGPVCRAAPVRSAFLLFLAGQCLTGLLL